MPGAASSALLSRCASANGSSIVSHPVGLNTEVTVGGETIEMRDDECGDE